MSNILPYLFIKGIQMIINAITGNDNDDFNADDDIELD